MKKILTVIIISFFINSCTTIKKETEKKSEIITKNKVNLEKIKNDNNLDKIKSNINLNNELEKIIFYNNGKIKNFKHINYNIEKCFQKIPKQDKLLMDDKKINNIKKNENGLEFIFKNKLTYKIKTITQGDKIEKFQKVFIPLTKKYKKFLFINNQEKYNSYWKVNCDFINNLITEIKEKEEKEKEKIEKEMNKNSNGIIFQNTEPIKIIEDLTLSSDYVYTWEKKDIFIKIWLMGKVKKVELYNFDKKIADLKDDANLDNMDLTWWDGIYSTKINVYSDIEKNNVYQVKINDKYFSAKKNLEFFNQFTDKQIKEKNKIDKQIQKIIYKKNNFSDDELLKNLKEAEIFLINHDKISDVNISNNMMSITYTTIDWLSGGIWITIKNAK